MIIDCHTHLGRNQHINATVNQLLASMDEAHIDKALVFAGDMNDCPNDWMLEQLAPHKDRLLPVAAYKHNNWGTWAKTQKLHDWYQEGEIAAVKFYTGYEHFYPSEVAGVITYLKDCPIIFHSGDCLNSIKHAKLKYAHPLHVDEIAVDFPNNNFIIAHMGNPWVKDTAEVCYKNANVYTDISGFVYGDFSNDDRVKFRKLVYEFLDIAGTDRLLFGTDWPISNQSSYLETLDWLATNTTDKKISECFTPEYLTQNVVKAFKL